MNKKVLNSVLLVSVLSIWGYVLYSKVLGNGDSPVQEENVQNTANTSRIIKKDSFILKANYRDPFLGKTIRIKPKNTTSPIVSNKKNVQISKKAIAEVKWPSIRYYGLIKNTSKKNSGTGLMSIDGKSHKINKQDEINDLRIISLNKDSVVVKFNKSTKAFHSKKKRL